MEILAVLLVIAVVVSMAAPVFRSVRFEIKNGQAKTAAKKFSDAIRSYYQISRGLGVREECFIPTTTSGKAVVMANPSNCAVPAADGIPYQNTSSGTNSGSPISQLFACGYLQYKDFWNLPYEFCACNASQTPSSSEKCKLPGEDSRVTPLVVARGASGAGSKYTDADYYIYVGMSMNVKDSAK